MAISPKTRKILWTKARNQCSFPGCTMELTWDLDPDKPTVIGEEAHIVSSSIDGPRGNAPLPLEERDEYPNLMVLCRNHHKFIDDNEHIFTVEALREMKLAHELNVAERGPSLETTLDELKEMARKEAERPKPLWQLTTDELKTEKAYREKLRNQSYWKFFSSRINAISLAVLLPAIASAVLLRGFWSVSFAIVSWLVVGGIFSRRYFKELEFQGMQRKALKEIEMLLRQHGEL